MTINLHLEVVIKQDHEGLDYKFTGAVNWKVKSIPLIT